MVAAEYLQNSNRISVAMAFRSARIQHAMTGLTKPFWSSLLFRRLARHASPGAARPNAVIPAFFKQLGESSLSMTRPSRLRRERTKKGEEPDFCGGAKSYTAFPKLRESRCRPICLQHLGMALVQQAGRLAYENGSLRFSVYDAFESGLVKIVRLPDPDRRQLTLICGKDVKGQNRIDI